MLWNTRCLLGERYTNASRQRARCQLNAARLVRGVWPYAYACRNLVHPSPCPASWQVCDGYRPPRPKCLEHTDQAWALIEACW